MAPAPKRTVLLPVNLSFSVMERKREKERGEEGEQERKKGKEGGEREQKREGMREREREREGREGGKREKGGGGKRETRNLPRLEVFMQGKAASFATLGFLGHHIRSVMSVQEGGAGFSWLPRSYQGTKKEGPHLGSFLAQVRISGNGDSFKYLFYKRL